MPLAFPKIKTIRYEGPGSKNPLAFKWFNPDEVVEGKKMKDHLRFSVVYWHTFSNPLSDPFGSGTAVRPWDDGSHSVENAQRKAKAAFEFFEKVVASQTGASIDSPTNQRKRRLYSSCSMS